MYDIKRICAFALLFTLVIGCATASHENKPVEEKKPAASHLMLVDDMVVLPAYTDQVARQYAGCVVVLLGQENKGNEKSVANRVRDLIGPRVDDLIKEGKSVTGAMLLRPRYVNREECDSISKWKEFQVSSEELQSSLLGVGQHTLYGQVLYIKNTDDGGAGVSVCTITVTEPIMQRLVGVLVWHGETLSHCEPVMDAMLLIRVRHPGGS